MAGNSHIVSIDGKPADGEPLELTEAVIDVSEQDQPDAEWEEEWDETPSHSPSRMRNVFLPGLVAISIIGWTAVFGWAYSSQMLTGATIEQWIGWISNWAMPVALILAGWLIAMRTSQKEQSRFIDVSAMMTKESARLEERLSVLNRELSLAREFIAGQSRDLEALGRIATERLSENAGQLETLISQNGDRIDQIADVSTSALENMGKLRDDLPVIANSARDVSNQIGSAGRNAHAQIDEFAAALKKVNDYGEASERQVIGVKAQADETIAYLIEQTDNLGKVADERFGSLKDRTAEFRAELDGQEVEVLAGIRRRAEALQEELRKSSEALAEDEEQALISMRARLSSLRDDSATLSRSIVETEAKTAESWTTALAGISGELDEMDVQISERSERLEAQAKEREATQLKHQEQVLAALQQQLDAFDRATNERQAALIARAGELGDKEAALAERMAKLADESERLVEFGEQAENALATALDNLSDRFSSGQATLNETEIALSGLTDASVRLLELIQASAQQSQEALPQSINTADERLGDLETRMSVLTSAIERISETANTASAQLRDSESAAQAGFSKIAELQQGFSERQQADAERIADLREKLSELDDAGSSLSTKVQEDIAKAVMTLESTHANALKNLEHGGTERLQNLAAQLGSVSADAVEEAVKQRAKSAIAELNAATDKATQASRDATMQLRDQLGKVAELTSNLESRVAHARNQAQENIDNDFARRVALITEGLNSNSIDIAKSLAQDVSETAWDAYLKGDRGIFTRRAVSLLDRDETREIAKLFENDGEFHENVSRYIHDFEAMLRSLLSTRHGNTMAVTMLSSDMGKLYVGLAQAIERFRD